MIVCGASQLNSQVVFEFFKENPFLLERGLIIPALRSDRAEVGDCISIGGKIEKDMRRFYNDTISQVVTWEHSFNATGFKNGLVNALLDDGSILRRNLRLASKEKLEKLAQQLTGFEHLSRDDLKRCMCFLDSRSRRLISKFANLIYYLSGSRTVDCETALRNLDYLDFSIADIVKRKTHLSEYAVFWKIFIELAFESLNLPLVPEESLDLLSFEEIAKLQIPIQRSGFCEEYDRMLSYTLDCIKLKDITSVVSSAEQLLRLRNLLAKTFKETLELQKEAFIQSRRQQYRGKMVSSTISLGVGLAGSIPGIGTVFNLVGVAQAGRELYVNIEETIASSEIQKQRERALNQIIKQSDFS
ncbi:hypothetical protein KA005_58595, partial [bacterium]|nr:hypothetical protein [bacterium]